MVPIRTHNKSEDCTQKGVGDIKNKDKLFTILYMAREKENKYQKFALYRFAFTKTYISTGFHHNPK